MGAGRFVSRAAAALAGEDPIVVMQLEAVRRLSCFLIAIAAPFALAGVCVSAPLPAAGIAASQSPQNAATPTDDLERLRAMLQQTGPDGRDARETAVQRLLGMPDPAAHRVLQDRLRQSDDVDGVREAILRAIQGSLVATPTSCFGGAADEPRRQILTGYLSALAPLWKDPGNAVDDAVDRPVRAAARSCLQRVPMRELDAVARVLLVAADLELRVLVLRCVADMQQVWLSQTIADFLEAPEEAVRTQARRSLRLLICHDEEFQTKAQFVAWFERNGNARYVDLAERAARLGPRPQERLREEIARLRVDAARDFVRALTVRTPGIDWAQIQARTLVDDPEVLDACLEQLQQSLQSGIGGAEDQPAPRQAFCRALLTRFRQVAPDQSNRRARLLEVAAYLGRPEDPELASELATQLRQELDTQDSAVQLAAIRGLRRFPSVEARRNLLRLAANLLADAGDTGHERLLAAMATLSSRASPRWSAPSDGDLDKSEWIAFVTAVCRAQGDATVRTAGLNLAQTLDGKDLRVPEVFGVLLALANDPGEDTKFRSTCLIHVQGWRNQAPVAESWVRAMHELLRDPVQELRQQAAESLARLPESTDPRRAEWIAATISALQDRLRSEPSPTVLRALVDCLLACGREPQMLELAIGALNGLFSSFGTQVSAENQFRLEPLLQALSTVAADPHAEPGQWLAACKPLLQFEKRQSLRLVLKGHGAAELAKSVDSTESGVANSARLAMRYIIRTALLKPRKEAWTSSEELQREAFEVRVAFGALDSLDAEQRLDEPAHRLLRLEVDLALGRHQDVVQRATAWLGNGATNGGVDGRRTPLAPADRDGIRVLTAEAQLALGKADAAARLLTELQPDAMKDPAVLDVRSRVGRALFATDPVGALAVLAETWKATSPDDPQFRVRLLDWMGYRLRHEPKAQPDVAREVAEFAPLFARPDCPADQRDQFESLRAAR